MIQLKVTWNNASSTLISNSTKDDLIIVAQGNAAAPEDKGKRTSDARVYTLGDDGFVKVTFDLKVDIGLATPNFITILKVVQRFECTAGVIKVHSYDIGTGPIAGILGPHPLVSMPSAQQASGTAVMVITTDFVDITKAWFEEVLKPNTDGRRVWDTGPHFDADFRVLACLSGTPKLWYASIPPAAVKTDAVGALVFFRPAGYSYQTANDDFASVFNLDHNDAAGSNFFKIWRFLITPVCDRGSTPPEAAKGTITAVANVHGSGFFDHMDQNPHVCAAIERSLKDANKPVVVLFPVVNGSDYGTATTEQLGEMARAAVACLHSMGRVVVDNDKKPSFRALKRLGVAGFSFGGTAMWAALAKTVAAAKLPTGRPNLIKEIYVFDANGWAAKQADPSDILTSATQTGGDLRLRVVAANSRRANLAAFAGAKLVSSAHPDFKANPDVFNLAKLQAGGKPNLNKWYFHYTKKKFEQLGAVWFTKKGAGGGIPDEGTWDRGARHQFAVFGGEDAAVGETFFCRFLKDSGF